MNKVIKYILAAGTLALIACSGKGAADATLTGDELTDSFSTSYCQILYKGSIIACGELSESKCKAQEDEESGLTATVTSSCPSSFIEECSIGSETVYTYDSRLSCDDFEEDDDDYAYGEGGYENEDWSASPSGSNSIGNICSSYQLVCTDVYACLDDYNIYSCSGSSCKEISENDALTVCMGADSF